MYVVCVCVCRERERERETKRKEGREVKFTTKNIYTHFLSVSIYLTLWCVS